MADDANPPETGRIDHRHLYEGLGELRGLMQSLGSSLTEFKDDAKSRWSLAETERTATNLRLSTIEAALGNTRITVERIRKPVDALISIRHFLLGLAGLVVAVGVIISSGLGGWHWFNPSH